MYIFQKTNITFSQIPKRTCAYRGIYTVSLYQPLAIIKKLSILDVAAALDPPLH